MSKRFNSDSSMIIEEHRSPRGPVIGVKEGSAGRVMRPEETGINQLKNGSAKEAFMFWMDNWSDIQSHLTYLCKQSVGAVLELGTRGGVSTSALLYGVEKNGGHVWSVDFNPQCGEAFKGHPHWSFVAADSLDLDTIKKESNPPIIFDLIFIDTEHTYQRLRRELAFWFPRLSYDGLLLMHDVITCPDMAKAAEEYAAEHNLIYIVRPGSNGLGVLSKKA